MANFVEIVFTARDLITPEVVKIQEKLKAALDDTANSSRKQAQENEKVVKSQEKVADANEKVADSQKRLADAEKELAQARKAVESTDEKRLTAREREADASLAVERANTKLAEAEYKLGEARAKLAKVESASSGDLSKITAARHKEAIAADKVQQALQGRENQYRKQERAEKALTLAKELHAAAEVRLATASRAVIKVQREHENDLKRVATQTQNLAAVEQTAFVEAERGRLNARSSLVDLKRGANNAALAFKDLSDSATRSGVEFTNFASQQARAAYIGRRSQDGMRESAKNFRDNFVTGMEDATYRVEHFHKVNEIAAKGIAKLKQAEEATNKRVAAVSEQRSKKMLENLKQVQLGAVEASRAFSTFATEVRGKGGTQRRVTTGLRDEIRDVSATLKSAQEGTINLNRAFNTMGLDARLGFRDIRGAVNDLAEAERKAAAEREDQAKQEKAAKSERKKSAAEHIRDLRFLQSAAIETSRAFNQFRTEIRGKGDNSREVIVGLQAQNQLVQELGRKHSVAAQGVLNNNRQMASSLNDVNDGYALMSRRIIVVQNESNVLTRVMRDALQVMIKYKSQNDGVWNSIRRGAKAAGRDLRQFTRIFGLLLILLPSAIAFFGSFVTVIVALGGALATMLGPLASLSGLLAGLPALAAAAGGALAGILGVFAPAVAGIVKGYQSIAQAQEQITREKGRGKVPGGPEAIEKEAAATRRLADARADAAQQIRDAEERLAEARREGAKQVEDAERRLGEARREAVQRVAQAESDLAEARREAARNEADAVQDLAQAQRDRIRENAEALQDYLQGVRARRERESDAVRDLRRMRRDAREEELRLERELADLREDATAKQEEAEGNLARIQAENARRRVELEREVRAAQQGVDTTQSIESQGAERARLAAAQAALRDFTQASASEESNARMQVTEVATESSRRQQTLEQRLADARRDNAEQISDAELELARLRRNNTETNAEELADLRQTQRRNDEQVAEAQERLNEVRLEGARSVAGAEARLREARLEGASSIADAERGVAEARIEAALSVRDAEQALADARMEGAKRIKDAMAGDDAMGMAAYNNALTDMRSELAQLDPMQAKLAQRIWDLKERWLELTEAARNRVLQEIIDRLDALSPHLKDVADEVSRFSDDLLSLFDHMDKIAASPMFQSAFMGILEDSHGWIRKLGRSALNFANALVQLTAAAKPMTDWMFDGIEAFSEWAVRSVEAGRSSGRLEGFFRSTVKTARVLGRIIRGLGGILIGLGTAGNDVGQGLLKSFAGVVEKWSAFLNSDEGQRRLTAFFERIDPIVRGVGNTIAKFAVEMFKVADALMKPGANGGPSPMEEILDKLQGDLFPALGSAMTTITEDFGPKLVDFLTELTGLFEQMAKEGGPISNVISILTELFDAINGETSESGVREEPGWVAKFLLWGLIFRATAFLMIKSLGLVTFGLTNAIAKSAYEWAKNTKTVKRASDAVQFQMLRAREAVGKFATSVKNGVKRAGTAAWGAVRDGFSSVRAAAGRAAAAARALATTIINQVKRSATASFAWVAAQFASIGAAAKRAAAQVVASVSLKLFALRALATGAWASTKSAVAALAAQAAAWVALRIAALRSAAGIALAWIIAGGWVAVLVAVIVGGLILAWNKSEWFRNKIKGWGKTVARVFSDLRENIANRINAITAKIEKFMKLPWREKLRVVGKAISDGLVAGMKLLMKFSLWGLFYKYIIEPLLKKLGIKSPSTLFKRFGKNIIEGLRDGIKGMFPDLWRTMRTLKDKLVEKMGDAITAVVRFIKSRPQVMANGFNLLWSKAREAVPEKMAALGGKVQDGLNWLIGKFNKIIRKLHLPDRLQMDEFPEPRVSEFAQGGMIKKQPGGIAIVAEAGYDELVLSTDPKYKNRSAALIADYAARMGFNIPRFATGGYLPGARPPGDPDTRSLAQLLFRKGYNVSSGGEYRGTGTYHDRQQAIDFGDKSNSMARLWAQLTPLANFFEELLGPYGSFFNGSFSPSIASGHYDHIHVAYSGNRGRIPNLPPPGAPPLGVPGTGETPRQSAIREALADFGGFIKRLLPSLPEVTGLGSPFNEIATGLPNAARKHMRKWLKDKLPGFATGGEVEGGVYGAARPIMAHVGEWVLNPGQQAKVAQAMGGWDVARKSLFTRTSPTYSFAAGGQVGTLRAGGWDGGRQRVVEQNVNINTSSSRVDIEYVASVLEQKMRGHA